MQSQAMTLYEWLETLLGVPARIQQKAIESIVILLLVWLLRSLLLRLVFGRVQDPKGRYQWKKGTTYIAVAISLVLLFRVWIGHIGPLATYLGLLSAGVAIALRDPLANLAAWLFILWRQPFVVGDRIQIGETRGDVVDVRIFQFTLLEIGNWVDAEQSTGRIIHIPNGLVFTQPLFNYTQGLQFIWDEIPVMITFESDWEKAKDLLTRIVKENALELGLEADVRVRKAAEKYLIFFTSLTPIVYTSVADSGVVLTMRYLCEPRARRGTREKMWEALLRAFAQCPDIELAYPTRRLFDNAREGKSSTGGPGVGES